MTPSFMGLIAMMLPGVRPSISLASLPTASTSPVTRFTAMMEGSLTMMPLPWAKTRVFAVPRSMARSLEKSEKIDRMLLKRGERIWKLFDDIYRVRSCIQFVDFWAECLHFHCTAFRGRGRRTLDSRRFTMSPTIEKLEEDLLQL